MHPADGLPPRPSSVRDAASDGDEAAADARDRALADRYERYYIPHVSALPPRARWGEVGGPPSDTETRWEPRTSPEDEEEPLAERNQRFLLALLIVLGVGAFAVLVSLLLAGPPDLLNIPRSRRPSRHRRRRELVSRPHRRPQAVGAARRALHQEAGGRALLVDRLDDRARRCGQCCDALRGDCTGDAARRGRGERLSGGLHARHRDVARGHQRGVASPPAEGDGAGARQRERGLGRGTRALRLLVRYPRELRDVPEEPGAVLVPSRRPRARRCRSRRWRRLPSQPAAP